VGQLSKRHYVLTSTGRAESHNHHDRGAISNESGTKARADMGRTYRVLLVNIGTPRQRGCRGVPRLHEGILSDPRVIEDQGLLWKAGAETVILRTRPAIQGRAIIRNRENKDTKRQSPDQDHYARPVRQGSQRDSGTRTM